MCDYKNQCYYYYYNNNNYYIKHARACTCASRVNNYSLLIFYGIFNYVQKKHLLLVVPPLSSFSQRTGLIRGDSIGLVFL